MAIKCLISSKMLLQSTDGDSIAQAPPVLPKEGEVYLFDLGPDNASWEQMKKKYRYDLSSSLA